LKEIVQKRKRLQSCSLYDDVSDSLCTLKGKISSLEQFSGFSGSHFEVSSLTGCGCTVRKCRNKICDVQLMSSIGRVLDINSSISVSV
jgi:hypothetical protein